MVAVAEGKVIAASSWGKVKTVFQIMAIVGFIVKDSPALVTYVGASLANAFSILSWVVMSIAIFFTILSAAQYFYHARHIITGPWSGGEPA